MQVHIPDPDYVSSERARANFRAAAKIALGFVVLLWLIQVSNGGLDLGLQRFGVHPREFAGLPRQAAAAAGDRRVGAAAAAPRGPERAAHPHLEAFA